MGRAECYQAYWGELVEAAAGEERVEQCLLGAGELRDMLLFDVVQSYRSAGARMKMKAD